jgi:hypothetical protein
VHAGETLGTLGLPSQHSGEIGQRVAEIFQRLGRARVGFQLCERAARRQRVQREARLDAVRRGGGNPFRDWQIPAAAIALKQGAGRLIRDVHDRGVLVLCDPRLTTRVYGKLFLQSLPPMPRTRALADVRAFCAGA